jgi:hypothetical protein
MHKTLALIIILIISVGGMLFSGYLSYNEVVNQTCALGGGCATMFGMPVCVLGFIMYLLIFAFCILGLREKKV